MYETNSFYCPNCENLLTYDAHETQVICNSCWRLIFTPISPSEELDQYFIGECVQWRIVTDKNGKSLKQIPYHPDNVVIATPDVRYTRQFIQVLAKIIVEATAAPPSIQQYLSSYRYMDNKDESATFSYFLLIPDFIGLMPVSGLLFLDKHTNRVIKKRILVEGAPYVAR